MRNCKVRRDLRRHTHTEAAGGISSTVLDTFETIELYGFELTARELERTGEDQSWENEKVV